MRHRRATSLVELLVLMSACSVILTLSAALLHRTMHIQSRSRSHCDAERSATRLSQQFRRDVHRASDHRTDGADLGEGMLLQLTHADGDVVQYAAVGSKVFRSLARKETIVAREEFVFPSAVKAEVHQEDGPTRLVLIIGEQLAEVPRSRFTAPLPVPHGDRARGYETTSMSLHAEAVLGRDLRYERVLASPEEPQ